MTNEEKGIAVADPGCVLELGRQLRDAPRAQKRVEHAYGSTHVELSRAVDDPVDELGVLPLDLFDPSVERGDLDYQSVFFGPELFDPSSRLIQLFLDGLHAVFELLHGLPARGRQRS